MSIHPTAVIEKGAKLADGVTVGPYCVIGPEVTIGANAVLHSHVAISGRTTIGKDCKIFPFASLGFAPQDLKYAGEKSELVIGDRVTIREHVTMNPGTQGGGMLTRVGDDCLFMVGSHVAHDCLIGNHVILVNNATLGGHVVIGDFAIIGGLSAVHQFVRIGAHAMIGGMSGVEHDVIPFGSVMGERANLAGLNLVGLKRRGFDRDTIHALRAAYRQLFDGSAGTLDSRAESVSKTYGEVPVIAEVVAFVRAESKRQICVPKAGVSEEPAVA
jgi:UDP-N-acetylglucosamine acyltransferase